MKIVYTIHPEKRIIRIEFCCGAMADFLLQNNLLTRKGVTAQWILSDDSGDLICCPYCSRNIEFEEVFSVNYLLEQQKAEVAAQKAKIEQEKHNELLEAQKFHRYPPVPKVDSETVRLDHAFKVVLDFLKKEYPHLIREDA